jgi:hypothetical protein
VRVTVSIPDAVGERAESVARERGVSVSSLYAEAVESYMRLLRRERAVARIDELIGSAGDATGALKELAEHRKTSDRALP